MRLGACTRTCLVLAVVVVVCGASEARAGQQKGDLYKRQLDATLQAMKKAGPAMPLQVVTAAGTVQPTVCPEAQTQCPPPQTRCPAKETSCPPVQTQCPATQTACPPG